MKQSSEEFKMGELFRQSPESRVMLQESKILFAKFLSSSH